MFISLANMNVTPIFPPHLPPPQPHVGRYTTGVWTYRYLREQLLVALAGRWVGDWGRRVGGGGGLGRREEGGWGEEEEEEEGEGEGEEEGEWGGRRGRGAGCADTTPPRTVPGLLNPHACSR